MLGNWFKRRPALSADETEALKGMIAEHTQARAKRFADHRATLVEKMLANTMVAPPAVERMDDATLEVVANSLFPPPFPSSRGFTGKVDEDEEDEAILAMTAYLDIGYEYREAREARRRGEPRGLRQQVFDLKKELLLLKSLLRLSPDQQAAAEMQAALDRFAKD